MLTVEVDKHPIGIILKSNIIKGIRFQISRDHWKGSAAVYNRLPEHVIGEIPSWGGRGKDDNKVNVDWVTDGSNSVEFLAVLLRPALGFKLLPYENGKTAPKAKPQANARATRKYIGVDESRPGDAEEEEGAIAPHGKIALTGAFPHVWVRQAGGCCVSGGGS